MTPEQAAQEFTSKVYGSTPFIPKDQLVKAKIIEYLEKLRKNTANMIYYICDNEVCPESCFSMLLTVSKDMQFTTQGIAKKYRDTKDAIEIPNAD